MNESCLPISIYLVHVNDWTQYIWPRVSFGTLYALTFLLGMGGNLGIVFSIVWRKRLKVVGNVFLINLAVSDLLLCLTAVPIVPFTYILKQWYLGDFMCKLLPFCQGTSVLITSISLVCIALDRYRNILSLSRNPWTLGKSLLLSLAGWVVSVALSLPLFLTQQLVRLPANASANLSFCGFFCGEFGWAEASHKRGYGTAMLFIQFLIPSILMAFCYTMILLKVKNDMAVSAVAGATQRTLAAARKKRVMIILILMVIAFVLSWLPLTVVNILRDFDFKMRLLDKQPFFSRLCIHSLAMGSVIWNPVLYFWMAKSASRKNAPNYRRTMDFECDTTVRRRAGKFGSKTTNLSGMSNRDISTSRRAPGPERIPFLANYPYRNGGDCRNSYSSIELANFTSGVR